MFFRLGGKCSLCGKEGKMYCENETKAWQSGPFSYSNSHGLGPMMCEECMPKWLVAKELMED